MNMNIFRISISVFISLALLSVSLPSKSSAAKKNAAGAAAGKKAAATSDIGDQGCKAFILEDAASGEVLAEKNPDMALPPASMVKLMVMYVTKKKVQEGLFDWTDTVRTSARASKIGGSQVYLKAGEEFTLEQMLEAVMIQSANDAATAIAEHIGGSVSGFVMMMNETALELGMKNTQFETPHGLPPSAGQKDDLTSPRDMAILARAMIKEFPEILEITGKVDGVFRSGTFKLHNHNNLLRHYDGCDGLKTGFHGGAGFCITATAQRNNVRMITVVMGCNSVKTRTEEASRLMSQGFGQYRMAKLIDENAPLAQKVPVSGGKLKEVTPVAGKKLTGIVRISNLNKITQKSELCPGLTAPVAKDTPCGQVVFMDGEREVGRVPAIIKEEIPKASITERIWNLF